MDKLMERVYVFQFMGSMLIMASASTIMLNTMKTTSDVMYNWGELIGLALSLVMYRHIEREKVRNGLIQHWRYTVAVLGLAQLSMVVVGWYIMEWRFFAIAVVMSNIGEGSSMIKWAVINNLISGKELTEFEIKSTRWMRAGQIAGLISILTFVKVSGSQLPIETGLMLHVLNCILTVWEDSLWYRYNEKILSKNISHIHS